MKKGGEKAHEGMKMKEFATNNARLQFAKSNELRRRSETGKQWH